MLLMNQRMARIESVVWLGLSSRVETEKMAIAQRIALLTIAIGIPFLRKLRMEADTEYVVILQRRWYASRPSSERLYFPCD